ncbi:alpha/beta hydrolase [Thalassobaculum sp.]|uniref:alpha/beta hydrolase n=1 Tax=Thalassobaculum sp. TaxID=2022740 RepID=UPI0032F0481D
MSADPAATIEAAGGRVLHVERPGGVRLRAARFPADRNGDPRGRCVFLSGYTEFIEKHLGSVAELTGRGFEVATLDWRGQGLSDRALADRHKGHIDRMETHLEDLDAVLQVIDGFASGPLTVVAHSMGAHIALRRCMDRPDSVARAVLIAPMLGIGRSGLPTAVARRLVEWFSLTPLVDSYVFGGAGYGPRRRRFEGNALTNDREQFEALHRLVDGNPDLALGDPTFGWVRAAFRSIAIAMAPGALEAVRTPALLALAGQETIVSNAAIEAAAARLPDARLVRFPDAKHEILREREPVRRAFWAAVDAFLAETGG